MGPAAALPRRAGAESGVTRLALEEVTFWYPATRAPALREVSLEVAAGEIVALVGKVGAGASTLLLVAADLAPRVTGGRLAGAVRRRARSGIVLPTPWTQLSGMAFTVWDEVAFGPANLGWPGHEIARHVDHALERLEIVSLAARDPITLSGGELQRVIVAGLLAMDPDLVLLDEPTAELDPAGARSMWRLLRLLAGEGKAIVVATSELDAVPDVADRVVWLEAGAVRAIGTPQLLAEDAACDDGLGTTVARIWRAAGLAPPYPLTVADAVQRWP
ncbi:MAG: energy-coupling factor ABC transporter ATP-binding protein [Gemmatimonadetes bacterium]|nr:MAG: energy-coupling factor ABC transporter ATP-binding protein [Gemmatimonadota bacterium]